MRSVLAIALMASPAAAQEFYGSAELSYSSSVMAGAPVALQGTDGSLGIARGDLTLGTVFGNGAYLQLDLGGAATDNAQRAPNTYNASSAVMLHMGRAAGRGSYGLFAGAVQSDHDIGVRDDALRTVAGLEGGLDFGARWSLDGHLGYLTGSIGSDSVDTVTDGVIAGLGLSFAATDRLNIGTSIGYIAGQMDAPSTIVEAWRLQVRGDYEIAAVPGMSLFGAVQYGEYHQKENVGPDDITDITSVVLGVTYRFGGKPRARAAKLDYLGAFMANTGGVLE